MIGAGHSGTGAAPSGPPPSALSGDADRTPHAGGGLKARFWGRAMRAIPARFVRGSRSLSCPRRPTPDSRPRGGAKPLLGLALLLALPAQAQTFNCVGAEQIEDDVFSVPFARGSARLGDAARTPLDSVMEVLTANPDRVACILGHAGQEGGATTSIRLAADRARAVSQALAARGVAAARLRAEARSAQFSPRVRAEMPPSRTVTVIVLPAPPAGGAPAAQPP